MAKFILAEKKEMTQKFKEDGTVIPVTRVLAGPCVITQVKNNKQDSYSAVQIGFGSRKNLSKSVKGHLKNLGNFHYLKEFRIKEAESEKLTVGKKITAKIFQSGDVIQVSGISKGKGFQGVVKRHGFSGSPKSHGHKDQLRMPGSIGATGPAHVFKGTRMGGQMGGGQVTVKNLEVVEVNPEKNEIFIRGAVPGPKGNLLLISGSGDIIIEEEVKEIIQPDSKTEEKEKSKEKKEEAQEVKTEIKIDKEKESK